MASEGNAFRKIIGDRLRQMFQQTVQEPLPPPIRQAIRRLHERDEAEAEAAAAAREQTDAVEWDLNVPEAPPERPRG